MDVIQKIHNLYPEMTRKQKSIADILLSSQGSWNIPVSGKI